MTGKIRSLLSMVYAEDALRDAEREIEALISKWVPGANGSLPAALDQRDALLIAYPDSLLADGEPPLQTLGRFSRQWLSGVVSGIHILPHYPFTSDDGFSVVDYYQVDPAHGSWDDVRRLGADFDLMLDAVINHMSVSSEWFQSFLRGEPPYDEFFINCDPDADYGKVVRPRALPLLTAFETPEGVKHVWTTFSADQADLNVMNPTVLARLIDVLIFYTRQGARYIRLDAIGFLWKRVGESCMNMPETHAVVKVIREVLNLVAPGVLIITETNVPHLENIAYFGNADEAHLVYNFALPPLTLHTFGAGDSTRLTDWLDGIETPPPGCAYFNFLSSHDGIGLRPVEALLSSEEQQALIDRCVAHGGALGLRNLPDGSRKVYELNINYMDALAPPHWDDDLRTRCTLAAHAILLSVPGVPAVYYHSLLGSRNDREGMISSGINRRINREKLSYDELICDLQTEGTLRQRVFEGMKRLFAARRACPAFALDAQMQVFRLDPRLVGLMRRNRLSGEVVTVIINITERPVSCRIAQPGTDLLSGRFVEAGSIELSGFEVLWIRREKEEDE